MVKTLRFMLIAFAAMVCNGAWADAYKTLTFPDDGEDGNAIHSYNVTWKAQKGEDTWIISNFNSNEWKDSYIACGTKGESSKATITTGFRIDKKIATVVVTIDEVVTEKVKTIQLLSASDEAFGDVLGSVITESVNAGELQLKFDVEGTGSQLAEGLYYKLVFDCDAADEDGVIRISKIQYFEEGKTPETGIAAIQTSQDNGTVIYNLNGQRLSEMQKGINIVNGKKVFVK